MLFASLISMGQVWAETEIEKQTAAKFQQNFNASAYDTIHQRFSPQMQKALPVPMLKQVSEDLKKQLGQLQKVEFIENKGKSTAIYKAIFEKDQLKMTFSLDDQQQMTGLFFAPYVESTAANNTTENHIQAYPKQIAEKIFAATRTFPENTHVAIAVVEPKQTQYYGVHKHDNKIHEKANQDLVFGIGSISKVMTATVLAELVHQKKISLDDHINGYYPFSFQDNIQLSFKSLSNHTAALPRLPSNLLTTNDSNPYKDYDAQKLNDYLKNELVLEPELVSTKVPTYSNLGVGLLGHSLALVEKTSLADLYQRYIFKPYGMASTFVDQKHAGERLVPAMNENGQEVPTWDFDVFLGAGGLLSTASDMSRFAQAQFAAKNPAIQLTQQATTENISNHQIGLGWFMRESADGKKMIWHGGNTAGHSSVLIIDLSTKKAVTILSNVSASHPEMSNIEQLAAELLK